MIENPSVDVLGTGVILVNDLGEPIKPKSNLKTIGNQARFMSESPVSPNCSNAAGIFTRRRLQ